MNIEEIIKEINRSMEKLDILSTKKMMEDYMLLIDHKRHHLITAARELYECMKHKKQLGLDPLTRSEVSVLYTINMYASKFDIIGIRTLIKAHPELWVRDDIEHYFNEEAKILLQGMNVIPSKNRISKQTPLSS